MATAQARHTWIGTKFASGVMEPLTMDAAGLVASLHGQYLRTACARLGEHQEGLSSAARSLFNKRIISNSRKKKLMELDTASIGTSTLRQWVAFCSASMTRSRLQDPRLIAFSKMIRGLMLNILVRVPGLKM